MPVYLESFSLPVGEEEFLVRARMEENGGALGYIDNVYPCCIFGGMELYNVGFSKITVFYGGNGSGKSTLLNLISERLGLKRIAPHNSGELFAAYAAKCGVSMGCDDDGEPYRVPNGSRMITSDDIFDYMLAARTNNAEIAEALERGKADYAELKFGNTVKLTGLDDYEALRLQVQARSKTLSRRKFLRRNVGQEARLYSNGETALNFFDQMLKYDTLYCLDEPENSMAPGMQVELAARLEKLARYCGCQLIIATHSPFLLSMSGARIYDLDSRPVEVRNWWELENTRIYFDFFNKHRRLFENDGEDG